jgi:hypothetical protein
MQSAKIMPAIQVTIALRANSYRALSKVTQSIPCGEAWRANTIRNGDVTDLPGIRAIWWAS